MRRTVVICSTPFEDNMNKTWSTMGCRSAEINPITHPPTQKKYLHNNFEDCPGSNNALAVHQTMVR